MWGDHGGPAGEDYLRGYIMTGAASWLGRGVGILATPSAPAGSQVEPFQRPASIHFQSRSAQMTWAGSAVAWSRDLRPWTR